MAGWSSLVKARPNSALLQGVRRLFDNNSTLNLKNGLTQQVRWSGGHHREMFITPTRFQWNKSKDLFHMYTFVGGIPALLVVFYCNVFIGPASLTALPEDGTTPKHWEYHRHPITRFIARYILPSPQQEYEKTLHAIHEAEENRLLYLLEKKVMKLMGERMDYQGYYYQPNTAIKYYRKMKELKEGLDDRRGDN